MEPRQSFAELVNRPELAMGTNLKSGSPVMAEALGYSDLDFLLIDRQHGSPLMEGLEEVVRAADLQDVPVVVRTPKDDTSMITYLLDTGVRGIMLPMVEDVETVREASAHMRYEDGRSLGSYTRAARFGNVPKPRYAEYVNEELALLPMIETTAGLDIVDELSSMPEVTALAIGPGDLAWSIGVPYDSPEHHDALDEIFEVAAANDCPVGTFAPAVSHVEQFRDRAAYLIHSSDVSITMGHFDELA
ncbi:HpcH/HpaI aldolase family protein [Natrialbaceae archaeon A-CW3]